MRAIRSSNGKIQSISFLRNPPCSLPAILPTFTSSAHFSRCLHGSFHHCFHVTVVVSDSQLPRLTLYDLLTNNLEAKMISAIPRPEYTPSQATTLSSGDPMKTPDPMSRFLVPKIPHWELQSIRLWLSMIVKSYHRTKQRGSKTEAKKLQFEKITPISPTCHERSLGRLSG